MDSGFFGIGISEFIWIAIIALIVIGPQRLPGALREVAKVLRTVRGMTRELSSQFGEEMKALEDINPQRLLNELTRELDGDDVGNITRATAKPSAARAGAVKKPSAAAPVAPAAARSIPKAATEVDKVAAEAALVSAGAATAPAE